MMIRNTAIILGLLGTITAVNADLIVVQDLGGTPLSQYVDMSAVPNQQNLQAALSSAQEGTINPNSLLIPQVQTEFSAGAVIKHQIAIHFPMPFFLIGGDDQSIAWATQNASYLQSIHAEGFIINVTATDQIKAIESSTGLNLMPGNVAGLSAILETNHYPFLVDNGWVSQ